VGLVRLILIRHAEAVERGIPGMADEDRPLTPEGEKRFKKAAKGLARLTPRPDLILTSPFPRARRTAEIAARAWGGVKVVDAEALAQGDFEALSRGTPAGEDATVVWVGHEPHLSGFLAGLLRSSANEALSFGKGGAALVDVADRLGRGGRLIWFLTAKALRRIAD
jgi:phosphohistidine phosphatase